MQWSEGGDHRPAGSGCGSTEAAQNCKYRLDTGIISTEAAQNRKYRLDTGIISTEAAQNCKYRVDRGIMTIVLGIEILILIEVTQIRKYRL